MKPLTSLCVFCGSSRGADPAFAEAARALGAALARSGVRLVYGGGNVGLMGVVADAALASGGEVVGVIPEALFGKEIAHGGLTELHRVHSMHERKTLMYDLSDAFVALPGGLGTLEEIFEILTWGQLGLHQKPCGFLNVGGYFDPLLAFLDAAVARRFVKEKHRGLILTASDVPELLELFDRFHAPRVEKWIEPGET